MGKTAKKEAKQGSAAKPAKAGPAKTSKILYWETNVPEQFSFYVSDGKVLKNLKELVDHMGRMSDDVFNFHANRHKNDFSNWMKNVMQLHDLAHNILGKNRLQTKEIIAMYIKKRTGKA